MADIQIRIFNNEILDQIAQELLCNLGIDVYNIDISTVARKLGLNVLSSSYEDNIAGYIKYEKNGEKASESKAESGSPLSRAYSGMPDCFIS